MSPSLLLKSLALLLVSAPLLFAERAEIMNYAPLTVVVCNTAEPASKKLALKYLEARGIPAANLVELDCSTREEINRREFIDKIEEPLRAAFTQRKWWRTGPSSDGEVALENKMRVITLIYGVPTKIAEDMQPGPVDPKTGKPGPPIAPAPMTQNCASVDSELVLLGLLSHATKGAVNTPYFNKDLPFAKVDLAPMLLVGRIDGPGPEVCARMIEDAVAAEKTGLWGRAYIDLALKGAGYEDGDKWIASAAQSYGRDGLPVIVDTYSTTLPKNYPMTSAAVYMGWYIRSADGPFLNPAFKFQRGAVACHIHSYSASNIRTPTLDWVAPLLVKGACTVLGNVYEPYLGYCAHLDVFNDRLIRGYNVAEAAWMATPAASWMSVVLGDPLYRPFGKRDDSDATGPDGDFRLYRSLSQKFGTDRPGLMKALKKEADARKSGTLWEALGLLSQGTDPDDLLTAAGFFEKAAKAYTGTPDKIRAYLQVPDMERRNNKTKDAIVDLRRVVSEFPAAPETEAARAWLNTLEPPPPPPPPPVKK